MVRLLRQQLDRPVHLVHRLDRATSGCLIVAFDPERTRDLQQRLAAPSTQKTYLALVRGFFVHEGVVEVDTPMKNTEGELKEAHSRVWALGASHEPRCSLLAVQPTTGRYHQVRRHTRDLHHPILGDSSHGDTRVNRAWREERGLRRLGLHCFRLTLGDLTVTCPIPDDLRHILEPLPWWADAIAALPGLDADPLPGSVWPYRYA